MCTPPTLGTEYAAWIIPTMYTTYLTIYPIPPDDDESRPLPKTLVDSRASRALRREYDLLSVQAPKPWARTFRLHFPRSFYVSCVVSSDRVNRRGAPLTVYRRILALTLLSP